MLACYITYDHGNTLLLFVKFVRPGEGCRNRFLRGIRVLRGRDWMYHADFVDFGAGVWATTELPRKWRGSRFLACGAVSDGYSSPAGLSASMSHIVHISSAGAGGGGGGTAPMPWPGRSSTSSHSSTPAAAAG